MGKKGHRQSVQTSERLEALQTKLMELTMEKENEQKRREQNIEAKELQNIAHSAKVAQLREEMSRVVREQEQSALTEATQQREAEKERMKHAIQMEKAKRQMTRLQLTIADSYDS